MLQDIINKHICNKNSIVTSAPGNGSTTFLLYLANQLNINNYSVIYYNPAYNIDRDFIKLNYPNAYNDTFFMFSDLDYFISFLRTTSFDYIIIDPGDVLLKTKNILPLLIKLIKTQKSYLICSSQIRIDIPNGAKPYSTIEKINIESIKNNKLIFDNSIWIRNATGNKGIIREKYIDVFNKFRNGNNYIDRYIAKFNNYGYILPI